MISNVRNVHREIIRDRVLEIEVPFTDIGRPQVAINAHDGAGLWRQS